METFKVYVLYTITIGTCTHHRFVQYSSIQRLILASEQQIYCDFSAFLHLNGAKDAIDHAIKDYPIVASL